MRVLPRVGLPADLTRFNSWLVIALMALVPACGSGDSSDDAQAEEAPTQAPPDESGPVNLANLGVDTGDQSAAIAGVVEFADFGCVHCATFHTESYSDIEAEFVDTGRVYWKYIPITLGGFPNGQLAGISAVCAHDQGIFAGMRDRLFSQREDWMTREEDEARDAFVAWADDLGADEGDFEDCLDSDEAEATIAQNNRAAQRIGIRVTPSFLIAGQVLSGAPPAEQFGNALNQLLADIEAQRAGEDEAGQDEAAAGADAPSEPAPDDAP